MHPDDSANPPPPANTALAVFGALLTMAGGLCGGPWTFLVWLGESDGGSGVRWNGVPLATILTLVGTICWIATGVLIIVFATQSGQVAIAAGKRLGIPIAWLALAAVGGYFFGFLACTSR